MEENEEFGSGMNLLGCKRRATVVRQDCKIPQDLQVHLKIPQSCLACSLWLGRCGLVSPALAVEYG
jgi:hypothetical protein